MKKQTASAKGPGRLLVIPLIFLMLVSACACSAPAQPRTSGISGKVLVGPVSPVESEGEANEKPLPDAVIIVMDTTGKKVAQTISDKDGLFRVYLAPGAYQIVPQTPENQSFPVGEPQEAVVEKDRFTDIVVHYDSGIR